MNKLLIYLALIAVGCYSQQAQNIDLSSLDANQGLTITIDSEAIGVGNVNFAGDVNKDGYNDLLLWTDFNLYLIYGSGSPSEINLSNFTLAQGFIISGASENAFSGAGDVNGDKIDDLMIANAVNNTVCVIFGSQLGFQNIDLNDCHNGTFGIEISGCPENYTGCNTGFGVSGAGDINGDNIQDMLISADLMGLPSSANRTQSGVVFVIYGFEGGVSSNINLTTLNSSQGFSIVGPTTNSYLGERMSKAGDVNGDGMNDIIVGAYYGFPAYVIYGNPMGNYNIDLANFNSSQGFTISVANQSTEIKAVTNAGDVNGDNIDDLLLGLDSNGDTYSSAYVLYGSNMMPFNVNISDIVPAQGFSIVTNQTSDYFAQFVSYLGDFNQDGLDDVLLSAYDANNGTGAAYVVFGTKSYPESINADTLPSTQGLVIVGANPYEMAGYTVSGVGDFNGDNVPDIALGTHSDIASGYVVYSPYKFNPNPKPLSAERIGYKAFIVSIVAFILCML